MSQTEYFALVTNYLDKCFIDDKDLQEADCEIARKILTIILNNCNTDDDAELIDEVSCFVI